MGSSKARERAHRQLAARKGARRRPAWLFAAAAVVVLAAGVGWAVVGRRPAAGPDPGLFAGESRAELSGAVEPVESFSNEGFRHVPIGSEVAYRTDPPTSGPHYDQVARPGFYRERAPASGFLVHNLEHGHVILYYNRQLLTAEELAYLESLTHRYPGTWDAVLAVPRDDPEHVLILTAWQHRQRLRTFDRAAVEAFVDRFRGRGPENPVR